MELRIENLTKQYPKKLALNDMPFSLTESLTR